MTPCCGCGLIQRFDQVLPEAVHGVLRQSKQVVWIEHTNDLTMGCRSSHHRCVSDIVEPVVRIDQRLERFDCDHFVDTQSPGAARSADDQQLAILAPFRPVVTQQRIEEQDRHELAANMAKASQGRMAPRDTNHIGGNCYLSDRRG